jgi:hypothetical protein
MPKASELPDFLEAARVPPSRRGAALHFDRDAEALVEQVHETPSYGSVGLPSWRGTIVADVADGDKEAFRIIQAMVGADPVTRVRGALNGGSVGLWSWRGKAVAGVAAAAVLLLVGWVGLHWIHI